MAYYGDIKTFKYFKIDDTSSNFKLIVSKIIIVFSNFAIFVELLHFLIKAQSHVFGEVRVFLIIFTFPFDAVFAANWSLV